MTMYYTRAEMDFVEDQRMRRVMEEAAKGTIELVKDEFGVHRIANKDGNAKANGAANG